mmetsp:Transcript_10663/g.26135  ORF Transcript_10663/g.26135 Transcript_10663/m.26135 type:complete len:235 (+) Transcript_10663:66-770(+)
MPEGQPDYVCACACGEVKFDLYGEPIECLESSCYCNDCTTAAVYMDEKAKQEGKKNMTMRTDDGGGVGVSCWMLGNMSVSKGKNKLRGFKLSAGSKLCRVYTSCCDTYIILVGNSGAPRWRGFNRNCITRADGSPFQPKQITKVMGKFASKDVWDKLPPENKYPLIPWGILPRVLSITFLPFLFKGAIVTVSDEDRRVPGLFVDRETITELVPPETYITAGFDLPKSAVKPTGT